MKASFDFIESYAVRLIVKTFLEISRLRLGLWLWALAMAKAMGQIEKHEKGFNCEDKKYLNKTQKNCGKAKTSEDRIFCARYS